MHQVTLPEWENFISNYQNTHLLQSGLWGEFKSGFGWKPHRLVGKNSSGNEIGVQILLKQYPLGFHMAYIPKGPVCSPEIMSDLVTWTKYWRDIDNFCKNWRVIFLKVEPDILENKRVSAGSEIKTQPVACTTVKLAALKSNDEFDQIGFQGGIHNIQPQRTLLISLLGDEDRILGKMKQKTRYNIRLALKKGVVVRACTNIGLFYKLIEETGSRDRFGVHSFEYYQHVYDLFHPRGMCDLLVAENQNVPLAAIMVFRSGQRAWYFYGASTNIHRELMPTYLLQWEAMRWARSMGCTEYDLWGVPDYDQEYLESEFLNQSEGLWGVYRFKRGFGGQLYRSLDSLDRVYNKTLYSMYKFIYRK